VVCSTIFAPPPVIEPVPPRSGWCSMFRSQCAPSGSQRSPVPATWNPLAERCTGCSRPVRTLSRSVGPAPAADELRQMPCSRNVSRPATNRATNARCSAEENGRAGRLWTFGWQSRIGRLRSTCRELPPRRERVRVGTVDRLALTDPVRRRAQLPRRLIPRTLPLDHAPFPMSVTSEITAAAMHNRATTPIPAIQTLREVPEAMRERGDPVPRTVVVLEVTVAGHAAAAACASSHASTRARAARRRTGSSTPPPSRGSADAGRSSRSSRGACRRRSRGCHLFSAIHFGIALTDPWGRRRRLTQLAQRLRGLADPEQRAARRDEQRLHRSLPIEQVRRRPEHQAEHEDPRSDEPRPRA
jgi:hypothetical protein